MRPLPVRAGVVCLLGAWLGVALAGCGSEPKGPRAGSPTRLIDADAVVSAYNARATRFSSLWARASVVLEGEDAEGRDLRERAEGHLQVIPPTDIAISLGKLGETNLYFGSNDLYYWWFDMVDSEAKAAVFGRHDLVTAAKVDLLGLPIQPLDLIETLGITPLPTDLGRVVARPGPEPGTIVLAAPTHRGVRRITVDQASSEPTRIELVGAGGRVLLAVELSRYRLIGGLGEGEDPIRVPERAIVRMAGFDGELRISLHEPERRNIRAVAFDLGKLLDVYRITDLTDLDEAENALAEPEPLP
jgi:hypothetical protein